MNVAAVVILYHPDTSALENMATYYPFVATTYAIDNSETVSADFVAKINLLNHCRYIADHENKGIASRLNQAADLAIEQGFDWLLTMDQDSAFEKDNFNQYLSCCASFEKEKVAVFGIQHEDESLQSDHCLPKLVTQLLTSGSLINLKAYKSIGGFDENLFIDQVDFEYCYRALRNELLIVQFDNIFLRHNIGKAITGRSFKTFQKTPRSLHAPIRLYYMTRNLFYVKARYGKFFRNEIAMSEKDLLVRIKNNLLYGKERLQVLKYLALGLMHYKQKRMGKL